MNVLVTGGAGYIGSHAVKLLVEAGHKAVVVDRLSRGHRQAVHAEAVFYELDLKETGPLTEVLKQEAIECVWHFAALAYVGESVDRPWEYYGNNVAGSLSLFDAMRNAGVGRLVFSSTCAVYGEPTALPIDETTPHHPVSPYGRSKAMVERILQDQAAADPNFRYVALRYFNVAGSAADGSLGEDHRPETHLVPLLLETALGQRPKITFFGDDYPTPDGSCIRDYLHVEDLCAAHLLAMQLLFDDQRHGELHSDPCGPAFNLGVGRGYSVREVWQAAVDVTGREIPFVVGPRRAGDPPALYAAADRANRILGWQPKYLDLNQVVETAWEWKLRHPKGYEGK